MIYSDYDKNIYNADDILKYKRMIEKDIVLKGKRNYQNF